MKLWLISLYFAASALAAPSNILNVSYDVTREFYQGYNEAFALAYQKKNGFAPTVDLSNGGSSKQARAVIDGLEADVVTMNQQTDIDAIAESGLIAENWQSRLPNNSAPYTSTIVFLVRKGNPKGIKDWGDLVGPGVSVIVPNPKTSGNGRYSYLAAWAYAKLRPGGSDAAAGEFVKALFKNVPVLETGGRAATNTFVQKEIGDVLLTFENEVLQITKAFSPDKFDVIYPPMSILAEAPASVVDKVVDRRGTRQLASDYLEYLWSEDGQKLAAQWYFRPRSDKLLAENAELFPPIKLVSVDEVFGGWASAQKAHFSDGGFFDQIYEAK
ncbi:MAG TPA: sulfate ABC transporter substrate-binding protein [Terrimicrobiaceae bacterium]